MAYANYLASFLTPYISRGSVTTHFRCGRMFNDNFIAESVQVKEC